MSGERIDIVPWHPDPEIYAKRSLAPAKVAKVISDQERKVITAIVDEDQLSLAIGRNGQNVRLASQLIGWQIDLYSSREWMERGAQSTLFRTDEYEGAADFPLKELDIAPAVLAALEAADLHTFMEIIDLERDDFLKISGIGQEETTALMKLIEELTIVEEPAELSEEAPPDAVPVASGGPFAADSDEEDAAAADDEGPQAEGEAAESSKETVSEPPSGALDSEVGEESAEVGVRAVGGDAAPVDGPDVLEEAAEGEPKQGA
jgi:N utilization substance protein A